jgi:hypothetical protein
LIEILISKNSELGKIFKLYNISEEFLYKINFKEVKKILYLNTKIYKKLKISLSYGGKIERFKNI